MRPCWDVYVSDVVEMRLALDLDGVIFDFTKKVHDLIPEVPAEPLEANVMKYLQGTNKVKLFNNLLASPTFFGSLPTYEGIENVIPEINKHDFYVVSARNRPVRDITIARVRQLGLTPADFVFTSNKGKVVDDYNLDILIEDQERFAIQVNPFKWVVMPRRSYNQGLVRSKNNVLKIGRASCRE